MMKMTAKTKRTLGKTCTCDQVRELLMKRNQGFVSLLDDSLLSMMINGSIVQDFEPKHFILRQHDPSDSLYLILRGRCTVMVNDKAVGLLQEGDLVGEMGVIQNKPRSASVMELEKTEALRISGDTFKKMLEDQRLSNWTINLLTDRLKRISHDTARIMKEMDEMLMDQMELARVQRSLLPKELPIDPRVRVHVLYSPCAYAGGDYYDALFLDKHRILLIVADVTGHGAQASISMAIVRSFIHQGNVGKTPETVLRRLNKYLFQYGTSQHFVTAQVAIIDLERQKVHFAYAGHPPMLHLRGDECRPLRAPRAFFLRFRPDADYKGAALSIHPGDRVALFTDGIIETFNREGAMFNVEGLENFLIDTRREPIGSIPTALETRLSHHREGSPVEDDITFLVAEIM